MSRHINAETEKVRFVTTIAVLTAPTAAEINAGVKLDGVTKTVTGFAQTADNKEVPDLGHRLVPSIAGLIKLGTASIDLYRGLTSTDVEEIAGAAMENDATGYIVFYDKPGVDTAAVATDKVDVWPVTVRANNIARGGNVDDPASRMVEFSIPTQPVLGVALA